MTIHRLALLGGLFLMPILLLWIGHGFRHLARPVRYAFWGGVITHVLAIVLTVVLLTTPAVAWEPGSLRAAAAHGSLLIGTLCGVVGGYLAGRIAGSRSSR